MRKIFHSRCFLRRSNILTIEYGDFLCLIEILIDSINNTSNDYLFASYPKII